jgi:hypothetical protein
VREVRRASILLQPHNVNVEICDRFLPSSLYTSMHGITAFIILLQQVTAATYAAPLAPPPGSSIAQVRVDTSESYSLQAMDNLDTPFTIEVNGKPITKVSDNTDEPIPAKVGSDAAVFTLKDGRLQCGDRVLGRNLTENRSMLPKPVYWFKESVGKEKVRPVTAEEEDGGYKIMFAGMCSRLSTCDEHRSRSNFIIGVPLKEADGAVFADLMNGNFLLCERKPSLIDCRGRINCCSEHTVTEKPYFRLRGAITSVW